MATIKLGDFSSWSVISNDVIIKHTDKSVFKHDGSAIDKRIREFWNADSMQYPSSSRLDLVIQYRGEEFPAHIEFDKNHQTRLIWPVSLTSLFNKQTYSDNNFPDLRFERIGTNHYEATFINLKEIEEEQYELESVVEDTQSSNEGKKTQYYTTKYERNPKNRRLAIKIHGTKCMACGFDFGATYGDLGREFIEVHHIKPLYSLGEETTVNPATDLVCLCSNCHRMVHRRRNSIITIEELQEAIIKHT